ncbi:MAG: hypothetical protein WDN45_16610 [Caulobacteraceae bacterium]
MREFRLHGQRGGGPVGVPVPDLHPMLCGQFLEEPQLTTNRFMRALEAGFVAIEKGYARGLSVVMAPHAPDPGRVRRHGRPGLGSM